MKKVAMILVVGVVVVWVLSNSLWADVIYVNGLASGANNGTSWEDAYTDLQSALSTALSGQEIWVAGGTTYKPTADTDRTKSFMMRDGVSLYGGFTGSETNRDQRNWVINETILSGDIGILDNNSDNSYHVVMGANDAALDGFTVTKGSSNGGGMYNWECSPTVANCIFRKNSGGGLWGVRSNTAVINCSFDDNTGEGAGITTEGGAAIVTNCTFYNNSAYNGGAITNYQCQVTFTNCQFTGNISTHHAGAMYGYESNQTLINCLFSGNSALYGGGIYDISCRMEMYNCTFSNNTANNNGGGYYS